MKITDDMLTEDGLRKLLSQVWNLGQTYWRQADSEFASDNRRSDETYKKYRAIVDESCEKFAGASRRTTPDREAWISVDDRLPPRETGVLVAAQFDHANDWRIKVGGLSCEGIWTVFGASWTPSHWMPLPTAPNGEKG